MARRRNTGRARRSRSVLRRPVPEQHVGGESSAVLDVDLAARRAMADSTASTFGWTSALQQDRS